MFIPNLIYYEKNALNYPLGKELFDKYNEKRIKERLNWMSPVEYRNTAPLVA